MPHVKSSNAAKKFSNDKAKHVHNMRTHLPTQLANVRISSNRLKTIQLLDNLTEEFPDNAELAYLVNHIEPFYDAIEQCDFTTFADLYLHFAPYIKPRRNHLETPLATLIITLMATPNGVPDTLPQRLFWQRVLDSTNPIFPISREYKYYRVSNQAWILLLETGIKDSSVHDVELSTFYYRLQNYFNSQHTIGDDLLKSISQKGMTTAALWRFIENTRSIHTQVNHIAQFKKLLVQIPRLKFDLTDEQKIITGLVHDESISDTMQQGTTAQKSHLQKVLLHELQSKKVSIEEALAVVERVLDNPRLPLYVHKIAACMKMELNRLNTIVRHGDIWQEGVSIDTNLSQLFSLISFDSQELFKDYPKATLTDRKQSLRIIHNLIITLSNQGEVNRILAANLELLKSAQTINQEWINFLEGNSLSLEADPLLLETYAELNLYFEDRSLPVVYSNQFDRLIKQGMALNDIWGLMGYSSTRMQDGAPLHAVIRMHAMVKNHATPKDADFADAINCSYNEIRKHALSRLVILQDSVHQFVRSDTLDCTQDGIIAAQKIAKEIEYNRHLLSVEFGKSNDLMVSTTSFRGLHILKAKLKLIEEAQYSKCMDEELTFVLQEIETKTRFQPALPTAEDTSLSTSTPKASTPGWMQFFLPSCIPSMRRNGDTSKEAAPGRNA